MEKLNTDDNALVVFTRADLQPINYRKWGADVGDLCDPAVLGSNAEPMICLAGLDVVDVGLIANKREGHEFWKEGEVLQWHGIVRGVEIWVQQIHGRLANGWTSYRVGFGLCPEYPPMVDVREASRLLRENVPPEEYVHVSPEEWAARRDQ